MARMYHDPSALDSSMPAHLARRAFLACVARLVPDVLATLRDDVLPVFRATWQDADPPYLRRWTTLRTIAAQLRGMPDARRADMVVRLGAADPVPIFAALNAWLERWNLLDDWCADAALSTLRWWANVPATLGLQSGLSWHPGGVGTWVLTVDVPALTPWNANVESWETFELRIQEWKARNREAAKRAAADADLELAPEKRARSGSGGHRHYEWLALYQCAPMSPAAIAEKYGLGTDAELAQQLGIKTPGRKTVDDAFRTTAKQIGLTPREDGG